MTTYERTASIERKSGDPAGLVRGLLATDGEASDGHILNIDGVELPSNPPLLFNHDDFSGDGNLGTWPELARVDLPKGRRGIRGAAQIELGGEGASREKRADVNHLVESGAIGAFSIRWIEISEPVRRVNLPSDHPAYLDPKKAEGRAAWGFYFDKSRLQEGSIVTLGSDQAALIGRMQESEGDVRTFWRSAINAAALAAAPVDQAGTLVAVQTGTGEIIIERAAYDAVLELANERLHLALDLYEARVDDDQAPDDFHPSAEEAANAADDPAPSKQDRAKSLTDEDRIERLAAIVAVRDRRFEDRIDDAIRTHTGTIEK